MFLFPFIFFSLDRYGSIEACALSFSIKYFCLFVPVFSWSHGVCKGVVHPLFFLVLSSGLASYVSRKGTCICITVHESFAIHPIDFPS